MGRPKGSTNSPKKRKAKDPNKPRRPTSAYFYFTAEERKKNAEAGKKITKVAEWTKEVSAIWREMSDKEKEKFNALAAKDRERYDAQMAAYKGKDANKPKRPQSGYFLWLGDFRKENKHKFNENKELLRAAGKAWKEMSKADQEPYEKLAAKEREKYEEAMREYHKSGGGASKAKKQKVEESNGADDDDDEDDEEDEEDEEDDDEEDEEDDEDDE